MTKHSAPLPARIMKTSNSCSHTSQLLKYVVFTLTACILGASSLMTARAAVALADAGGTAPTPGTYDISQLSTSGNSGSPNSKNYYSNNGSGNTPPGEKFTTGANAGGYTMTDIYIQGGNGSGNGIGGSTTWTLYIFSISGTSATLLTSYAGLTTGAAFNNGDWLHFSGLSIPLAANTTYAYAISSGSSAYTGLENSTTTLSGANALLIPGGGGTVTTVTGFNGVFDIALTLGTTATVAEQSSAPTPGASDVSQLSTTGDASNPNSKNYFSNNNPQPGQQFTTPSGNPGGYTLTGVYVRTGNSSGNSIGKLTPWTVSIYSVSGGSATLINSYSGLTGSTFTLNDWIYFSGLSIALAANTTYAYSVSSGSNPYTGLENSTATLAGANAELIPLNGGSLTTVTGFNGVFDVVLSPIAAPGPPTAMAATPANNQVTVSWTAPSGTVTGYNVYRSITSGSGFTVLPAGANVSASPFTDTTAVNGTVYYYEVTALNGALESAPSSQVSATPPRANVPVTWNGIQTSDNNWTLSMSEGNWSGTGSGNYFLNGDAVVFNDDSSSGAQTVTLNTSVSPGRLSFVNTNVSYTVSGTGAINGLTGLTNAGPGTVILAESGGDAFSGGINAAGGWLVLDNANGAIAGGALIGAGGVLQVGNNDGQGTLPAGAITNNGTLVFNHGSNLTVTNIISGSGLAVQQDGNLLTLSGANTFTNTLLVTNNSTLQAGSDNAFGNGPGATVVASGSTLDENGFYNGTVASRLTITSGAGVGGAGALVNNSGYGDLLNVTLAGDTTVGGTSRLDFTGQLKTGGNAYNLTITGSAYHEWNNLTVDTNLANVTVTGTAELGDKGTTAMGNPAAALTVMSGAMLTFWQNGQPVLTKHLVLNDGSTLHDGDASAIVNGPITLTNTSATADCYVNVGGPSLTLNGPLDGNGVLDMVSGTGTLIVNSNSPTFTGGALVNAGTLIINASFGSGTVTTAAGSILAGTGTVNGLADISGALLPGNAGVAGTFHAAGGLTLEASATLTNDLSATIAGNNDLVVVTGDLTANGNMIDLNLTGGTLQNGIYRLITYTGNLNGSFGGVQTVNPSVYSLTLTNITTTTPKQIAVIVTGNPSALIWNDDSGSGEWNVFGDYNWTNHADNATEQFVNADYVIFDDSITSAANGGQFTSTNVDIASGVVVAPTAITNNSTVNYTISGAGSITGTASIVKLGSSTLTLSNLNTFTGGVAINAGAVQVYGASGGTGLGSGTPAVNAGATLIGANGDAFGYAPNAVPTNILINGGTLTDVGSSSYRITMPNVTFNGGTLTSAAGNNGDANGNYSTWGDGNTCTITSLAASTTATISATTMGLGKPTTFSVAAGSVTGGATPGVDLLVTSKLVPYGTQPLTKTGAGTLALDANNTFLVPITIGAGVLQLGTVGDASALTSPLGGWPTVTNNATLKFASAQTVTVTNVITGTGTVVVAGGTAILDGVNTYTGNTTINAGLLAGSGTLGGNLVVNASGTVSAGESGAVGVLTATGNTTLGGTALMKLNDTTNDEVSVGGTLYYGGTLVATNISLTALTSGQAFKLFNASTYSGNFAATNLPVLTAGLAWNWTPANGTLSVVQSVNTSPTNITVSVSGNVLTLSWPTDHTGWRLQAQTNSLQTGITTSWIDVSGSTLINHLSVTNFSTNSAVFYRMVYP